MTITKIAEPYRTENNRPGGVVTIFKGQAGGGDPYNGAEEWQALA